MRATRFFLAFLATEDTRARDAGDVKTAPRMASATRRAKKEIELQSRKRDSEKKEKAEYMKGIGGSPKYITIAIVERGGAGFS